MLVRVDVQDFQARAKAQDSTPTAMQEFADANRALKAEAAQLRTRVMRRIIAELSLELEQAKAERAATASVARPSDRTTRSRTARRD